MHEANVARSEYEWQRGGPGDAAQPATTLALTGNGLLMEGS